MPSTDIQTDRKNLLNECFFLSMKTEQNVQFYSLKNHIVKRLIYTVNILISVLKFCNIKSLKSFHVQDISLWKVETYLITNKTTPLFVINIFNVSVLKKLILKETIWIF